MSDIYSSSVVALLNLDGADGSTSIVDSSYAAKTYTVAGAAAISTTEFKWGGSSLRLPSAGSYVATPGTTDFVFGTGNFTLECWVKTSSTTKTILDFYTIDGPGWILYTTADGYLQFYTTVLIKTGGISVTDNLWHHIAVSRVAGVLYFFVDGALDGAGTAFTTDLTSLQTFFAIGAQVSTRNSSYDLIGYIDDVRITKGVGRYTTTFSRPTAALALNPPDIVTAPSPTLSIFGGGRCVIGAPSPIFFSGEIGRANAALVSPKQTLSAFGGANVALVGTSPILLAQGRDSTSDNAFIGIAPSARLVSTGGANARLTAASPVVTITGTFTGFSIAALTAPSPKLAATGAVSAVGSASLVAPMASVISYSGAVCSITLASGHTLQATGTGGSVGIATLSCPLFELTASGTSQNYGSASLLAPSPRMGATAQAWLIAPGATLTAIGTAVVTAAYQAYSVNLNHRLRPGTNEASIDEMTRYTNFPFDRIVRYQNSYFGVAADGLYLLEGTTDDGTAIACTLETHVDDFDVPEKKTIVSARIGGRFGPTATVALHVGETGETAYPYTTPRGQLAQNHREKFGRGIKNRYFGLEVATTGALEIDQLELEINKLTRRI